MKNEDFAWFVENYDSIFKRYGHKFIVIKNKVILGVYDDIITAIDKTSESYELGSFIVQECNGDPSAYTSSIVTVGMIG